jgi:hypothetical protein
MPVATTKITIGASTPASSSGAPRAIRSAGAAGGTRRDVDAGEKYNLWDQPEQSEASEQHLACDDDRQGERAGPKDRAGERVVGEDTPGHPPRREHHTRAQQPEQEVRTDRAEADAPAEAGGRQRNQRQRRRDDRLHAAEMILDETAQEGGARPASFNCYKNQSSEYLLMKSNGAVARVDKSQTDVLYICLTP